LGKVSAKSTLTVDTTREKVCFCQNSQELLSAIKRQNGFCPLIAAQAREGLGSDFNKFKT